jgi:regulator of sigma E protease
MKLLAGKPAVLRVKRKSGETADLLVPPAFHVDLGLRMQMGPVAAVRSPGTVANLVRADPATKGSGDTIVGVQIERPGWIFTDERTWEGETLDPMRLPSELLDFARKHPGPKWVTLKVPRPNNQHEPMPTPLPPILWDDTLNDTEETPSSPASPLSIPQIGVAYYVNSTVAGVTPDSPATLALRDRTPPDAPFQPPPVKTFTDLTGLGATYVANLQTESLQPGDTVVQLRFRQVSKDGTEEWTEWADLNSTRGSDKYVYDEWACYFTSIQNMDSPRLQFKVRRGTETLDKPFTLTAVPDRRWPLEERGLLLTADTRTERGETVLQSIGLGARETYRFIIMMYLQLRSLVTGRISSRALGGPIEIATQAFYLSEDPWLFLMFLGMLSINLAVINFLPIPLMDGGHMVFLIWEKVRGKPPSERVREIAAYIGLAFIALLMLFVFSVDIDRRFFGGRLFGNR